LVIGASVSAESAASPCLNSEGASEFPIFHFSPLCENNLSLYFVPLDSRIWLA
jgi:hypothetical protein